MVSTIRTTAKIPVSREVRAAFVRKLQDDLAGFYDQKDIQYTRRIIADAERHAPERWQPDTKQEFIYFLEACAEVYAENRRAVTAYPRP